MGFEETFRSVTLTLSRTISFSAHLFLFGLAIPAISLTGAMLVRLDAVALKPIDWRILGGGCHECATRDAP